MSNYKVMHIEDDETCGWLLREKLKEKGVSCLWVSKKEEVEFMFSNNNILPNLVVCDGQIPYWSGHIAETLRLKPKTIPMVIWTGDIDPDIYLRDGIDRTFSKGPDGLGSLIGYIEKLALSYNQNGSKQDDSNQQNNRQSNR